MHPLDALYKQGQTLATNSGTTLQGTRLTDNLGLAMMLGGGIGALGGGLYGAWTDDEDDDGTSITNGALLGTLGGLGVNTWRNLGKMKDNLTYRPDEIEGTITSRDLADPEYLRKHLPAAREYRRKTDQPFYQDISDEGMNRPVEWAFGNDRTMSSPGNFGAAGAYSPDTDQIGIRRELRYDPQQLEDTLRHEVTHSQQRQTYLDHAKGLTDMHQGDASYFRPELGPDLQNYLSLFDESEARAVALKRRFFDDYGFAPTKPEEWWRQYKRRPEAFEAEMQYVDPRKRDNYFVNELLPTLMGVVQGYTQNTTTKNAQHLMAEGDTIKQAVVKKVDGGKYDLMTQDGSRRLGTHDSKQKAYKQEYAIQKSQEERGEGDGPSRELGKKTKQGAVMSLMDIPERHVNPLGELYKQAEVDLSGMLDRGKSMLSQAGSSVNAALSSIGQAGNSAMGTNQNTSMLGGAGVGALTGGLGLGAMSLMGGDEEESTKDKLLKALAMGGAGALAGGVAGGAGGYGLSQLGKQSEYHPLDFLRKQAAEYEDAGILGQVLPATLGRVGALGALPYTLGQSHKNPAKTTAKDGDRREKHKAVIEEMSNQTGDGDRLKDTKVRFGGTGLVDDLLWKDDPDGTLDWSEQLGGRVWQNPKTTAIGKLIGTASAPLGALGTALGRGTHYNQGADTLTVGMDDPVVTKYHAARAAHLNRDVSPLKRDMYMLARGLPFVESWDNAMAARRALGDPGKPKKPKKPKDGDGDGKVNDGTKEEKEMAKAAERFLAKMGFQFPDGRVGAKIKDDHYAKGQEAWDSVGSYLKGNKDKDPSAYDPAKNAGPLGKVG